MASCLKQGGQEAKASLGARDLEKDSNGVEGVSKEDTQRKSVIDKGKNWNILGGKGRTEASKGRMTAARRRAARGKVREVTEGKIMLGLKATELL